MDYLENLLAHPAKPAMYFLDAELAVNEIQANVQEAGYNFIYFDGDQIGNETEFFQIAKGELAFPYFGWNWDAFDDCMSDLTWLPPASGNVIVLTMSH